MAAFRGRDIQGRRQEHDGGLAEPVHLAIACGKKAVGDHGVGPSVPHRPIAFIQRAHGNRLIGNAAGGHQLFQEMLLDTPFQHRNAARRQVGEGLHAQVGMRIDL